MTWKGKPSTRKDHLRAAGVSGWEEQRQAKRILERDGHQCQLRMAGCIGTATFADHRIPLSQGGPPLDENMQAACRPCHDTKTKAETAESRKRETINRPQPKHPGLL